MGYCSEYYYVVNSRAMLVNVRLCCIVYSRTKYHDVYHHFAWCSRSCGVLFSVVWCCAVICLMFYCMMWCNVWCFSVGWCYFLYNALLYVASKKICDSKYVLWCMYIHKYCKMLFSFVWCCTKVLFDVFQCCARLCNKTVMLLRDLYDNFLDVVELSMVSNNI